MAEPSDTEFDVLKRFWLVGPMSARRLRAILQPRSRASVLAAAAAAAVLAQGLAAATGTHSLALAAEPLVGQETAKIVAVRALSSIHIENGGRVYLMRGDTASVQTTSKRNVSVDAEGRMVIGPCNPGDCTTVTVVSPHVPSLSVQGATIIVEEGFPDQAEASASIKNGGLINLMEVSVKSGSASIKQGGQIMIHSTDNLTVNVQGGGNVLYLGAPNVNSNVKDGGWVFRIGQ